MDNRTGVPFPPPVLPVCSIGAGAAAVVWLPRWPLGLPWMIAGGVLFALAAAFVTWALMWMRLHRTTPNPFGAASALLTSGPYRVTRNPMYLSLVTAQTGVALAFGLPVTLALVPVTAVLLDRLVIRREEAFLRATFPAEFESYAARVRRWI